MLVGGLCCVYDLICVCIDVSLEIWVLLGVLFAVFVLVTDAYLVVRLFVWCGRLSVD